MPETTYPTNGTVADPLDRVLPRRPCPGTVFDILRKRYDVPDWLIDRLSQSVRDAVARMLDKALDQRHYPQAYFVVRQLDGEDWLA
jgi:hypothetical protein